MKNDIYSMLNEANINSEDYEKEYFNDIEKKNIKENFRKSILRKKSPKKRIVAASVVIALTVTLFGTNVGAEALTRALKIVGIEDISSFMRIQKNLDEYKTVINKAITDNGITVQLKEVILDGDELVIFYNITSDEKLYEESWETWGDININEKVLSGIGSGFAKNIDNYTTQEVASYSLENNELSGDLNITVSLSTVRLNDMRKNGTWNFEFKTNGDALKIDTKETLLNNKFTIQNGQEYTLEKYTDNSLGQKIYASISNYQKNSDYDVKLKGIDDLGNEVEFCQSRTRKDNALLKIDTINGPGNLNENAKTLTLTPYAAESLWGHELKYEQVGKSFTIDLTQLK